MLLDLCVTNYNDKYIVFYTFSQYRNKFKQPHYLQEYFLLSRKNNVQ